MKTPINTVVPQPGKTFPASEFNGRSNVPSGVEIPGSPIELSDTPALALEVVPVAIMCYSRFFLLSVI